MRWGAVVFIMRYGKRANHVAVFGDEDSTSLFDEWAEGVMVLIVMDCVRVALINRWAVNTWSNRYLWFFDRGRVSTLEIQADTIRW
mmetsp:Transcript_25912/g.51634  ORF Transcript_25912/g.51634 Transcript_25912/m.51634 type:complete len:86 (+) Transcript_25912:949-1206(+)